MQKSFTTWLTFLCFKISGQSFNHDLCDVSPAGSLSGSSYHHNQESLELDPIPSPPVMATPLVSSSPEPLLEYHHDPSAATLHCHCIQIPVSVGPLPTKLHVVQLCVHRNWCPSEDTQIHLVYDTATLSRTPLHPPPHLCT